MDRVASDTGLVPPKSVAETFRAIRLPSALKAAWAGLARNLIGWRIFNAPVAESQIWMVDSPSALGAGGGLPTKPSRRVPSGLNDWMAIEVFSSSNLMLTGSSFGRDRSQIWIRT